MDQPIAYWPMAEMVGPATTDASGNNRNGAYEGGYALYLDGPATQDSPEVRAVHFAGGRMTAELPKLGNRNTVECWFWNGVQDRSRFVRRPLIGIGSALAVNVIATNSGSALEVSVDSRPVSVGPPIMLQHWHHMMLVRDAARLAIYLDGAREPRVIDIGDAAGPAAPLWVAGRANDPTPWEGKICQVAVYDKPLPAGAATKRVVALGR